MKRIVVDALVIVSLVALSFVPLATHHFLVERGRMRIFAAAYALIAVLAAARLISSTTRAAIDVYAAILLALMAGAEMSFAGNHLAEIAIDAAISGILVGVTLGARIESPKLDAI